MSDKAFQDSYSDLEANCYGCGRLNKYGLHIKSYWDGEESVCIFNPESYHVSIAGYVYGGLIASIIDCHSVGMAKAVSYRSEGREIGTDPVIYMVTASLKVDYINPAPISVPLEVRASVEEMVRRKVIVLSTMSANGEVCARGRIVAVRLPEKKLKRS
jgi:acyl-coenzyme A thioesterase PaaI-like protein